MAAAGSAVLATTTRCLRPALTTTSTATPDLRRSPCRVSSKNAARNPHHAAFTSACRLRATRRSLAVQATAVVSAPEKDVAVEEAHAEEKQEQFNWFQHWYPVAIVQDLDPAKPTPFTILGQPIVLWRDGSGAWRAFHDRCPHRLARLSEGRLENGQLQCAYHGWEFASDGNCSRIPQLQAGQTTPLASPRACATTLAIKEELGMLWVWPDSQSKQLADTTPVPLPKAVTEYNASVNAWYMRDVAYSYDLLWDNTLDLSHIWFAHHGIMTFRRENFKPREPEISEPVSIRGFATASKAPMGTSSQYYRAPQCYDILHTTDNEKKVFMFSALYYTPISVGRSRVFVLDSIPYTTTWWPQQLKNLLPRWLEHQQHTGIFTTDDMLLVQQERDLEATNRRKQYLRECYMPAPSDRLCVQYDRWHKMAGPPQWVGGPAPLHNDTKEQILDRYHTHTKHCKSCRDALRNVRIAQTTSLAVAFALVAIAAAEAGTWQAWALSFASIASVAAHFGFRYWETVFVLRDTDTRNL
eukprot:jgi/Chlat1/6223/Chrsp44S05819